MNTNKDTTNPVRRQELVSELQKLGVFDTPMLIEVMRKLVQIGMNPGALRAAVYNQWRMEMVSYGREQGMTDHESAVMGLLCQFDLYGLEDLVSDAREQGIELTYARFLEAAFQKATKIGEQYERASKLASRSLSGGGEATWKQIYVVLKWDKWNPFETTAANATE